ncbi:hypothetical protein Apmu_0008_06 [Acidiphilium multivorum AIU301]|jgi:hypothetical protein|nr:hypothetical protein Apmu_0008_06 [Acidiphilium multivorum AIU301]
MATGITGRLAARAARGAPAIAPNTARRPRAIAILLVMSRVVPPDLGEFRAQPPAMPDPSHRTRRDHETGTFA